MLGQVLRRARSASILALGPNHSLLYQRAYTGGASPRPGIWGGYHPRDRKLPDLSPLPPLDSPEQARFWLFDAVTTFLKTAARRQPLVLILDDLHWADQPSLLLLQFITRELGGEHMLLVGTYRDA